MPHELVDGGWSNVPWKERLKVSWVWVNVRSICCIWSVKVGSPHMFSLFSNGLDSFVMVCNNSAPLYSFRLSIFY